MSDKQAVFLFLFLFLIPILALAQSMDLPEKSPRAKVGNTIGYTEITIDYGSPEVRGREIWGVVVPYDKTWRAGANKATTITFSTEVDIESHPLEAGTYSFFVIPKEEGQWTIIFNKNPDLWGTYGYQSSEDVLRINVSPRFSKKGNEESLTYQIERQNLENGYLLLSWEKLRLYMRIKVDAMDKAVEEIKAALTEAPEEDRWKVEAQSADFLLWAGQPGPASAYAERSIALNPCSWNYWLKAKIHAALGDIDKAIEVGRRAVEMGMKEEKDNYYENKKAEIDWQMKAWKKGG